MSVIELAGGRGGSMPFVRIRFQKVNTICNWHIGPVHMPSWSCFFSTKFMLLHACLLTCACKSRELRGATRHRRVEGAAAAPSADPVMDAANAAWERALERGQAPLTTAE